MSSYVLIHGAFQGGWRWKKIIPLLEKEGHEVVAPDLPGHGKGKKPVNEITLKAYTDRVCQILDQQSEPVILAGHRMGGVVIRQAAEYRPEKRSSMPIALVRMLSLQNLDGFLKHWHRSSPR
jgi:pimeloyl-ACP methyl ester carboxylesterase